MRKTSLALATAAFAGLLAACTMEPAYQRPAAPVPADFNGAPPQAGTAAADIGWREFFTDPQLQQLIALALANNRDLRVAALNVQSAQAQYRIQRADLFPTIAATGSENVQRYPGSVLAAQNGGAAGGTSVPNGAIVRTYNVGIGFTNYELDFFGRIRSLNHAALQQYFGTQETQRSAQLTLVAEVAEAYLLVLADETLYKLTSDTLKSQSDSYDLTKKLFDGGATTQLALRQAESTVDTARANLALYTRQLAQDRDALQLLLGAPIPDGIDFSGGLDRGPAVAELEEGIPSDVLVRRPDVLAAEHQLLSANADIGAARAAFFPSISLTGNFGTESTQLSGLFKDHSQAWTFSPQISVPIFAGGANLANLDAAKLQRDTAVAQYEKAIQSAFREVADALAARGALNDQQASQQALVTASQDAFRLADMRFRGGVDSYLSVLDAQRTLYSAQQELQNVRLTRLQNLVTLYKALGGGLQEHTAAQPAAPADAAPGSPS
ncbi:efflux transporter outer membrane subunit [Nevskia soli]|uniref:efflux transporter outer membrane subunit n=1 Tax=Nevskia soli TaxID=418856 RepID=UPI0004A76737